MRHNHQNAQSERLPTLVQMEESSSFSSESPPRFPFGYPSSVHALKFGHADATEHKPLDSNELRPLGNFSMP